MRRAALSLLIATLAALPAGADGFPSHETHAKAGAVTRHPGVVVTVEHGVRVWRPVTAAALAIEAPYAYPQTAAEGANAGVPEYGYSQGLNGYGFGYGGLYPYENGFRLNQNRTVTHGVGVIRYAPGAEYGSDSAGHHPGRAGTAYGVTIHRPQLPRYALAPVRPVYGALTRPTIAITVNPGYTPHAAPRGYAGGHGLAAHRGGGGHAVTGHGGGHGGGGHR